jgi:very-short-patch-repair endonuclease
MYMLQNPSQPPLIKGGARCKQSQNSVTKNATKSPHDKGGLYKFVPYNTKLVQKARELRKSETGTEKVFWKEVLTNKEKIKYKFTRQKPIDNFIVDFYCAKLALVIETDGLIHLKNKKRDKERDYIIEQKYNLKVVRYQNDAILNDMQSIVKDLQKIIKQRESEMRLKVPMIRGI